MISSNTILNTFLYMYIAPRQGQKTPWGQTFDVNRKPLSLGPFLANFKQISLNSILYTFFNVFPHVYWKPFVDKILMSTEKPCDFAHLLQVSKKYLWSLILYIIFHVFIHIYSPGAGAENPWGQNFYININLLSLWSFAVSFFHLMTF